MICVGPESPLILFRKQGNIYVFQNKQQNSHKLAETMKKTGFLVSFILEGTLTVFLSS